jgi:small subunit ribosomal protein S9
MDKLTQEYLKSGLPCSPFDKFFGRGKKKRAVARVQLAFQVDNPAIWKTNNPTLDAYIKGHNDIKEEMLAAWIPLTTPSILTIHVHGGGVSSQISAIRSAVAKAVRQSNNSLIQKSPSTEELRRKNLLISDPRKKERKKYGLRKARRAPQFSKR